MAARRRSRGSSRRGTRQKVYWQQSRFIHPMLAIGNRAATDISHDKIQNGSMPGGTCLRLLIDLEMQPDETSAVADWAFGVLVTDSIGTASAIAEAQQDWYAWSGSPRTFISLDPQKPDVLRMDIRSARKLREGYRLTMNSESSTLTSADFDMVYSIRSLWTLA